MKRVTLTLAALTLLLAGVQRAKADFSLDSIDAKYLYPTQGTTYQDLGTQAVNPVAHFNSFGETNYDVSATQINITNSLGSDVFFLTAPFNGVSFTDVTKNPNITNVTVDSATNLAGFDASRVSWTSDTVFVNLQSLTTTANTLVRLDVQFGGNNVVPEPASITLFGMALLTGAPYFVWRRRKQPLQA